MSQRIYDSTPTPPVPPPLNDAPAPDDLPFKERITAAVKKVYDPEIPVNIYDLGLIYKIDADESTGIVKILMTLTTPNCPEAQTLPGYVRQMAERVKGAKEVTVEITWEPPWHREMMSEEAKLELGMM